MINTIREYLSIIAIYIAFTIAPKDMGRIMKSALELGMEVQKAAYAKLLAESNKDTPQH